MGAFIIIFPVLSCAYHPEFVVCVTLVIYNFVYSIYSYCFALKMGCGSSTEKALTHDVVRKEPTPKDDSLSKETKRGLAEEEEYQELKVIRECYLKRKFE